MRYPQLTEVGHSLATESIFPVGIRTNAGVWRGIEQNLKLAIIELRNLYDASSSKPASSSRSVKDLINFHETMQSNHQQGVAGKQEIDIAQKKVAAQKKVDYYRRWLSLEGATADADGNVHMSKMQAQKVYYDSDAAKQGLTRVHLQGGLMYTDSAKSKPLSTRNMVTHNAGPGKAIYVMSQSGTFHVASHIVGRYHHSSLLAGQAVACAGEMEVDQGKLLWLSNKSGHYQPNLNHLVQVLHQLQKSGVPMTFRMKVFFGQTTQDFNNVGELLTKLELDGQPDYELVKLLAYSQHLNNAVLNTSGWRWSVGTEKPGVYDINTNAMIPHKTVRTWLKGQGLHASDQRQSGSLR